MGSRRIIAAVLGVVVLAGCERSSSTPSNRAWAQPPAPAEANDGTGGHSELVYPSRYESARAFPGSLAKADRATWRAHVPAARVVTIPSSVDGAPQRALVYDSGSERPKPLLVVLHSWSANFLQNAHIPYAEFAVANDWVFVHPDFRGRNRRPQATLSELAVQDVLDAIEHARASANVDDTRIYLLGYSAGAMMGLVLAGRYPDRFAGVAAWVAVYDLLDWYEQNRRRGSRYAREIERSCGGVPRAGSRALRDCLERSPSTHLSEAAGRTPILLVHGIRDYLAPPTHAIDAFNALARPDDRIDDAHRAHIVDARAVPPALRHDRDTPFATFAELGAPVVLQRSSQGATLVLFDGAHDMFYRPGLRWLAAQRRDQPVDAGRPERVAWASDTAPRAG